MKSVIIKDRKGTVLIKVMKKKSHYESIIHPSCGQVKIKVVLENNEVVNLADQASGGE